MARKSSGLRNRYRNGRGTYSKAHKSRLADHYGKFINGKRIEDDKIRLSPRAVDTVLVDD